jgi:hypothetical protein
MNQHAITSFVVRFQKSSNQVQNNDGHFRIKVTHVQQEEELTFESLEDVFQYMKKSVEHMEQDS